MWPNFCTNGTQAGTIYIHTYIYVSQYDIANKQDCRRQSNQMSSDRAMEWFRALVGAQQWDYVVLWKLGNDPSRFYTIATNLLYFIYMYIPSFLLYVFWKITFFNLLCWLNVFCRFIEWMGCCCSGGCDRNDIIVNEEKSDKLKLLCRDNYLKHSVRTKACESLSQFPCSMPLYSGCVQTTLFLSQPLFSALSLVFIHFTIR